MFEDSKLIIYDTDGKELGTLDHIEEAQLEADADDSEIQRLADNYSRITQGEISIENLNELINKLSYISLCSYRYRPVRYHRKKRIFKKWLKRYGLIAF